MRPIPDDSLLLPQPSPSSLRLHEVRDRLDSVVDNVVDSIITIDASGTIESVNPATEAVFGYSPAELVGQNVRLLMPEPYRSQHDSYLANYFETGIAKVIGTRREVAARRKDGSVFPIDLAISRFRFGGRQYFTGIIQDISERKKLEFEQQETNERLQSVMDHVVDGILTVDETGTVASFNRAAESIFGYTAAEIVGGHFSRLIPDCGRNSELTNSLPQQNSSLLGGERDVVGQRKDGSLFPLDLALSDFQLQGKRFFTGIVRDITERKRAEDRTQFLANATALLSSVVDSSRILSRIAHVPISLLADWCVVDLIGPAGHLARSSVAHHDLEKKGILRQLKSQFLHSDRSYPLVFNVLQRGQSRLIAHASDPFEFVKPRTPEDRELLLSLNPQSLMCVPLGAHDRVFGAITFVLAETDRQYVQADLLVAEDFANRASIALENVRLYDEAREADRRKDEFLAMLAHELRNPLRRCVMPWISCGPREASTRPPPGRSR